MDLGPTSSKMQSNRRRGASKASLLWTSAILVSHQAFSAQGFCILGPSVVIGGRAGIESDFRSKWSVRCTEPSGKESKEITVSIDDIDDQEFRTSLSPQSKPKRPRIPILHYSDDWVCVDKPAGMSVHSSSRRKGKKLPVLTATVKRQLARKVFPVHRLDHRTSGCMLLAFDSETCGRLHAAIKTGKDADDRESERIPKKEYVALVRGKWTRNERSVIVDKPLLVKDILKDARTRFTVLATTGWTGGIDGCTLLLCEPITGRTHQIRRHAYHLGYPIIGDTQHGDTKVNRWWREARGWDRLGLHCLSITFDFDEKDEDLEDGDGGGAAVVKDRSSRHVFVAPFPEKLRSILKTHATDLWDRAISQDPRLLLPPVDLKGGTHGRNYRKTSQGEN